MDNKGDEYCRKYTLEQICLEVLTFKETRFIEFVMVMLQNLE